MCDGDHDARCLLDPKRESWADIVAAQDDPHFGCTFQQDPSQDRAGLVEKVWLVGGTSDDGEQFEGCLDQDRGFGEYPSIPGLITYVTVDRAMTTGNWAVTVWATNQAKDSPRWLIDGIRKPLRFNDFVHVDPSGGLAGVMPDLQRLYSPTSWVIESNIGRVL